MFLALIGHVATTASAKHAAFEAAESALVEHKPAIIEFGVGCIGGSIASGLVKSFAKFAIILGAGVFVAAHGLANRVFPNARVESQFLDGIEKDLTETATNYLDFDNDGKLTPDDLKR